MKFKCPYCRKELDWLEIAAEENIRAIIAMRDAFHPHSALVWAYVELFGVSPMRTKARKLRVLLEDVKRLFEAESFSYQKKVCRISRAGIAEALGVVVRRNFAEGLDSHNYLKKIMIGISEREAQDRSRAAERDLRRREERLMSGEKPPSATLTDEEREANLRRVQSLQRQIWEVKGE